MNPLREPILVTRPTLPDLTDLGRHLADVWASGMLTNGGAKHALLERLVGERVCASHARLVSSGTAALVLALRALRVSGEVITSPLTFCATPHAISWAGGQPIFADVDPRTMTLDPVAVEQLVTPRTTAILAVHAFGEVCNIEGLQRVADRHGLRVVYDASHAFAVEGISDAGDASAYSLHATKLLHTGEGGVVTTRHADVAKRVSLLRNFGIEDEVTVSAVGLNAKMSEVNACVGLCVIGLLDAEIAARAAVAETYREKLSGVAGVTLPRNPSQYFAVRLRSGRDAAYHRLRKAGVLARRYLYPLCSDAPCYASLPSASKSRLPNAARAASETLCLPFHGGVTTEDAASICDILTGGES